MRPLDLPLDQTAASRFLLWIVAGLVFLMVVALGMAAIANDALALYNTRSKLVTVTLPAEANVEQALDLLRKSRGVVSANPVAPDDFEALVAPWLDESELDDDLPLPKLIDVTLDPAAHPDLEALASDLEAKVPGSRIGVEAMPRDRAERIATFVRAWSSVIGGLLLVAMLAIVVWTTQMSLKLHASTVELLRHMGAGDGYVARQFERHALFSSIWGGLLGFALGALVIVALLHTGRQMGLAGSIDLDIRPLDWLLLGCIPVVVALLVTLASRITAIWGLSRISS
jgi:cell division transport system permease protein